MMYNLRSPPVAPFDGKYLTSYLMAMVMFAFLGDTWQNRRLKSMILKTEVKVIEYNIWSYAIR